MNIPKTKKITKCRFCFNKKLIPIYKFGSVGVVDKKDIKKGNFKLNLVYCNNCKLLQLEHSAPQEIMYKKFYWYRSSVTHTMISALKDIHTTVKKLSILKKNDTVLDIGANDGTLLNFFKKDGFKTIGCEPAKNLVKELKKNCNYVLNDFWNLEKLNKIIKKNNIRKPKLITAIGMFYDLEDPSKFIADAAEALEHDGIFIAQLMCLNSMLKKNDLGNICHEHLEFYSYESLKYLFEKNGFKIFKVNKDINGGSYRIYCKKNINKSINYKENIDIRNEFIFPKLKKTKRDKKTL